MPVPTWPEGRGQPLADGYRETEPDLVRRSETDSGPAKQSRTGTSGPAVLQVAYILTAEDRLWLRSFYRGDAAGGAVWFNWWFPVERRIVPARFLAGSPPVIEAKPPSWIAGVTLEVRL